MFVTILSSGTGWHVQDLLRAAKLLPVRAGWLGFAHLLAGVREHREHVPLDPILVRTMAAGSLEQVIFRMDVLHRCKAAGVPVMNPPRALETCIDKYLCTARLASARLAVPETEVCQDAQTAMQKFHELGGNVLIKPLFGSEGRGIVHVTDPDACWRVCHALEHVGAVLYLQQFIPHEGCDLRLFVLGDRVLTAMRRRAGRDWRTNIAQGGIGEAYQPSKEETQLALEAAAAVGATYAGVNLLPGKDGRLYVLEVNGVPGWRTLGSVTGVDVAAEILRYLTADSYPPKEPAHATP